MAGKPLHDDQILKAVNDHWQEFLFPPPIQYLIDNTDIKSKNTVWIALRRLEKRDEVYLIETGEGMKVYTKWAWHALYLSARQSEEL